VFEKLELNLTYFSAGETSISAGVPLEDDDGGVLPNLGEGGGDCSLNDDCSDDEDGCNGRL
jgi:hypothetical protein